MAVFDKINKILRLVGAINWKTVYVNFKYFHFKDALKLPLLISNKVWLRECSGKIEIVGKITSGMIRIGFGDVGIFDKRHSRGILEISGKIKFYGKANIGHGSKISVGKEGTLEVGTNFVITAESSIICFKKIKFGDNCLISWDSLFMDNDFHKIIDENNNVLNEPREIIIGNNVWIGCRCLILKGAKIKDGNIIGANNSTVSNKLEKEKSVYVGNPLKCIKENIKWLA